MWERPQFEFLLNSYLKKKKKIWGGVGERFHEYTMLDFEDFLNSHIVSRDAQITAFSLLSSL